LIVSQPHSTALAILLAVLFVGLVAEAQGNQRSSAPGRSTAVPQTRINPGTIKLPIVDGEDMRFARLSTSTGLLQTKIAQIVQDDQGFLWFGTQYGLIRYDGYSLRAFVNDPKDPHSLNGVQVDALFKDRDGVLWVGCNQFLNKFDQTTETFVRYPVQIIKHISQDAAGMLWLATPTGLYELDPATARIRRYSHDRDDPLSLSSNNIESSGEDKDGKFWVANTEALDEFDRKTGKVRRHIPLLKPSTGVFFFEDRFGVFWIFNNSSNVLEVFDRKTNALTRYSFEDQQRIGIPLTGVTTMLEDRNGTLWIATHGSGLLKFDREHQRFIRYRNDPTDPDSLPQNNVESLIVDREGGIWAGLGRVGAAHFDTISPPFHSFPHLDSPKNTVKPFVGAIYEDSERALWIGTPAALNRIDRGGGRYTYYRLTAGPADGTDVIAIGEDRSGGLWVGTYGHGLLHFDRRTGQFHTYRHNPADPYSLSSDIVFHLLVDHNGRLWAATSGGLSRFDAATERFITYKPDQQGNNFFYLQLVEDQEGILWLGSEFAGLQRFDPATGKFTVYLHDLSRSDGLSDNRVNSVYFDHSGAMWVGTQNGLDKLDRKEGTFTVFTARNGLAGNAVGCVLEDDHGLLWMSTNSGISSFSPLTERFANYTVADGLPGPDLTGWGACFKSPEGEMFFGGFSGPTAFFPEKVGDRPYIPPIVLTDFRLFGTPVELKRGSPLTKSISYTDAITLSHKQSVFSIGFSALSYFNAATNRYRYKLEGLDHQWNEVGSDQRLASYTTLPAGIYTFHVQGATSRGAWSEPGAQLRIEILPPWWDTLWFRVICGLAAVLTLWGLYHRRVQQLVREYNMRLDERVNERARIARELHDTLLQSFQGLMLRFQTAGEMLPARPLDAKKALEGALDRADEAISEGRDAITDIRASTLASRDLEKSITALMTNLSEELAAGNGRSVTFRVLVEGVPRAVRPTLQDEIYRIARESLRNAFRHAQAGHIETEITYGESLRLRFRDDGKGIDPSVVEHGGRSGHWGLPGIRERAKQIGAQLTVWSELGAGTEVELSIPGPVAYEVLPTRARFRLFYKRTEQDHEHRP
jgi:signal transduction histidine kinase/ligand-binding sensor domain-containing protein